jgi:hypothetical protein
MGAAGEPAAMGMSDEYEAEDDPKRGSHSSGGWRGVGKIVRTHDLEKQNIKENLKIVKSDRNPSDRRFRVSRS